MQDNPFRVNPVTVEVASLARKNNVQISDKDKDEAELKEMRIHAIKTQLNKDREAIRVGKMLINNSMVTLNTHHKNLLNTRIKRAIYMLDKEYGLNPKLDDGFNEVLEQQNKK